MIVQPVVRPHLQALSYAKRLENIAALLVYEVTQSQLKELDPGVGAAISSQTSKSCSRSRLVGRLRERIQATGVSVGPAFPLVNKIVELRLNGRQHPRVDTRRSMSD